MLEKLDIPTPLFGAADRASAAESALAAAPESPAVLTWAMNSERLRLGIARSAVCQETFAESIAEGLSRRRKTAPCRWFYDRRGSALFEQICELPEYYLTRTERSILQRDAAAIVAHCPGSSSLIELGSGSSMKTRLIIEALLNANSKVRYCPIDISAEMLSETASALVKDYRRLEVVAIAADYAEGLSFAIRELPAPRIFLFLGSTIGNFEHAEAVRFLSGIRRVLGPRDRLLLGADLVKSPEIITAAYNDSEGVTAAFNRNLLRRVNEELGGNFDLQAFHHAAPYSSERRRVEMRLVSARDQDVSIQDLGRSFHFEEGESIHTESCHKYTLWQLSSLVQAAGLEVCRTWCDPSRWFALSLLGPSLAG